MEFRAFLNSHLDFHNHTMQSGFRNISGRYLLRLAGCDALMLDIIKLRALKVSKSQNKFMKSPFLPKNERNIARISALNVRAEILAIFRSFFGKNDDFIISF